MNVWIAFLGTLVRWLLAAMFGGLVVGGIIDQKLYDRILNEGTLTVVAWILGAVVPILWSVWQKIGAKVRYLIAKHSAAHTDDFVIDKRTRSIPPTEKVRIALTAKADVAIASKVPIVILISLLGFGAVSCSTAGGSDSGFESGAREAVVASADLYDVTMIALGELYKAGRLTNADRDQAVRYANVYRAAALTLSAGASGAQRDAAVAQMHTAIEVIRDILNRSKGR